jgi:aryl-alcohol dehydrogenase-like predicted oxidoreductase
MEYRQVGGWGPRISVLGLGSYLTIGFKADAEASRNMVRRAYEGGINFFDTANRYHLGKAEESLGVTLAEFPRSSLVVLHPAVSSVILGTRTVAQVEKNLAALDVDIPADVVAELDALFPVPGEIPGAGPGQRL